MEFVLATLFAVVAPPLIALRWDGRKLHRLRKMADAAGRDPSVAGTTSYLRRGLPAFALMSVGLLVGVALERFGDVERRLAIAAVLPFAIGAIWLQHRVVRGIERDVLGRAS